MYPLTNLGCHRLRRHHHHHLEVIQQISITCKQNMSYCKMTKICNYIIFELKQFEHSIQLAERRDSTPTGKQK